MPRTAAHVIETESKDIVRSKINAFYENGDALVREWSEREYGIDFVIEIFDNGLPTGKIAFVQLKGTEKRIEKLKKTDDVSCPNISVSSLDYAYQMRIPFILIYASIANPQCFYYVAMQSVIATIERNLKPGQKRVSVRIPMINIIKDDLTNLFETINNYYL